MRENSEVVIIYPDICDLSTMATSLNIIIIRTTWPQRPFQNPPVRHEAKRLAEEALGGGNPVGKPWEKPVETVGKPGKTWKNRWKPWENLGKNEDFHGDFPW